MIKKAIVCCHEADQEMLPIFIERWRDLYPDVELWLGNDSKKPVTIEHDLPIVKITWGNGVAKSIINAMLETGGDIVAKLDVDTWHLKNNLFDPFSQSWVMASGHQWQNEAGRFLGIAYAIKREALLKITISQSCDSMRGNQEDTAMSQAVRRSYPNGVYLFPFMQCRRADTWGGEDASLIHCGLYGHDEKGRSNALIELQRLASGEHVTSSESAWVGMSVMPSRLHGVGAIVERMSSGVVKPKRVILSIPEHASRTEEEYDETEIARLEETTLVQRTTDLGPITKYVGLCELVGADDLCIVLDDDCSYSPQLVARMVSEYKEGHAMANRVISVSGIDLPEGCGGVIFRRSLIDLSKLKRLIVFLDDEFTEALLADDAVMGWFFQSQGVQVTKLERPVYAPPIEANYDACALHKIDGGHFDRYQRTLKFLNEKRAVIMQLILN
jgi:hypothetical protein